MWLHICIICTNEVFKARLDPQGAGGGAVLTELNCSPGNQQDFIIVSQSCRASPHWNMKILQMFDKGVACYSCRGHQADPLESKSRLNVKTSSGSDVGCNVSRTDGIKTVSFLLLILLLFPHLSCFSVWLKFILFLFRFWLKMVVLCCTIFYREVKKTKPIFILLDLEIIYDFTLF